MAKSFHNIIKDGTFVVSHRGEDVTLTLPEWLSEAKDKLDDEKALTEWAKDNGVLHALLHAGIQQLIINLRAIARPPVNIKTDESLSIIVNIIAAQERINEYIFKPVAKPGQASVTKIAKHLEGMTKEQVLELLATKE